MANIAYCRFKFVCIRIHVFLASFQVICFDILQWRSCKDNEVYSSLFCIMNESYLWIETMSEQERERLWKYAEIHFKSVPCLPMLFP